MWIRHRNKLMLLTTLSVIGLVLSHFQGGLPQSSWLPFLKILPQAETAAADNAQSFTLSQMRRIHILVGDGTGGGHKFGAGQPGKTEFPQSWDDEKIISVITRIANDPQLPMRPSGRRYWLRMGEEDGIQIRVVLDRERAEIITGYPVERRR